MADRRVGSQGILMGATSLIVTFTSPLPNNNYQLSAGLVNLVDPGPMIQDLIVKGKSINGFSVEWPAPTDSANYRLEFIAQLVISGDPDLARRNISDLLSIGTTQRLVTFTTVMPDLNYAVQARLVNLIDPAPQFQPLIVTSKSVSGFVAAWPAPTDSGNYRLDYLAQPNV